MEYVECQGVELPKLGLGTWRMKGATCRRAVRTALELGYRHVDTAQYYGNERQVGTALRDADVDRESVFLTTKLKRSNLTSAAVHQSTRESLRRLGTDYLNLLLIHQPSRRVPVAETIRAMNELQAEGVVRHVGVSNFGVSQLSKAQLASETPIFTDQVQYHPYKDQHALLNYCRANDMLLTAYSPLAHGGVIVDDLLQRIGEQYDRSAAQVALRWAVQQDHVVTIPKAASREHLRANLDVFDFELTPAEMDRIGRPSTLRTISHLMRSRLPV